jgi:hypothetical protein
MNRFKSVTDGTADRTTSHLTDKTTSHSTWLSKDDNQVAGYNPAKDAGQVIGYSHSTWLPNDGNQVAGYKPLRWLMALLLVAFVAGCGGGNGSPAVTPAPTVSFIAPANAATGIALNANITATFSEAMNASTITTTTFTLKQGITPVSGAVTYVGTTAIFNPASNLTASAIYTATVTTGVKDLAGNALAVNKTWSFTTGTTADTTAPTVSSTAPATAAIGIALNANVTATFSEAMDPSTITTTTYTLKQGTTIVPGAVTYVGTSATFNPTSNLAASTIYTATVTTGVKDLAGNPLAVAKTWSFTTGTTVAAGPKPVVLGTAGNYAILTKTGITTTGTTAVTGDIGTSPAAATYIQGFTLALDGTGCFSTTTPTTLVTGKVYAADYNTGGCTTPADLTTAVLNMQAAYTDAAGRTATSAATTNVGGGTLSNLTLAPGVYEWGSNVTITTDLTLNGAATDVWIFKVSGTLDIASNKSVIPSGGALAKNIFWQVADVVTIGTGAHFEGIVLGQTAIVMTTGASINGRLLAQSAVTLDATTVTQPAP